MVLQGPIFAGTEVFPKNSELVKMGAAQRKTGWRAEAHQTPQERVQQAEKSAAGPAKATSADAEKPEKTAIRANRETKGGKQGQSRANLSNLTQFQSLLVSPYLIQNKFIINKIEFEIIIRNI